MLMEVAIFPLMMLLAYSSAWWIFVMAYLLTFPFKGLVRLLAIAKTNLLSNIPPEEGI